MKGQIGKGERTMGRRDTDTISNEKKDYLRKICPALWDKMMVANIFFSDGEKETATSIITKEFRTLYAYLQTKMDKKKKKVDLPN
jgi:hypothetical protein